MERRTIATERAPAAIGPYVQGVVASGGLLFTAGQIALDPVSGAMAPPDIALQTRRVLDNLRGVVEAAGSCLDAVIKVTIFLRDLDAYPLVNEIYAEYFTASPPARTLVEVSGLPKDALIEMECVAGIES